MKRILVALLLLFGPAFSQEKEFSDPLLQILSLFEIPPDQAVVETQKLWLQTGKERWEFDTRYETMRSELWPLFEKMGLLDERAPKETHYDYAIILGALLETVENRVNYLQELLDKGICFHQIVFLSGERPLLDRERERLEGLETEFEMVRWVYDHSHLPREIAVLFIDARKKNLPGIWRPQTDDTVFEWLKTNPSPGLCLAISSQPYVDYQNAVLRRLLPQEFTIETVGPKAKDSISVAVMLETVAKALLWEHGAP